VSAAQGGAGAGCVTRWGYSNSRRRPSTFVSHQLLSLDHPLDALNPADKARMGTRYLRHLLGKTNNDLRQALIAYNQGLGALRRNGPYPQAQRYADRVLALRPMFTTG